MPSRPRPTAPADAAPRKLFVDSGAWIALVSARDQHHANADALIRKAVARRIVLVTSNLVLAEVHRLLRFRAGFRAALAAVGRIEESAHVTIVFAGEVHHRRALAWLERLSGQAITYTDAVSFALMESLRCTAALTFDHDFEIAGFTRWVAE